MPRDLRLTLVGLLLIWTGVFSAIALVRGLHMPHWQTYPLALALVWAILMPAEFPPEDADA